MIFAVEVWNGKTWRKRRDVPTTTLRSRAERMAASCERAPRRESSSDGRPHRVVEVKS